MRCALVFLALLLQVPDLRAELLYRSLETVDGQQRWSQPRKYVTGPGGAAVVSAVADEEVRVVVSGAITREDVEGAGVMAKLLQGGRQRLQSNTVWFASSGGDMDAAMDLGRLLRELRVFAAIGEHDQCMSACAFAFMGGERRSVSGKLGIHRPYFPYTHDVPGRQLRFRHLQRTLKGYLDEMDFPASLYEAVMLVPPEDIRMLAPSELKTFYLDGISPSSEDLADAAAARQLGLSMVEYLKVKAGTAKGGRKAF
jgi:hypothetical protein